MYLIIKDPKSGTVRVEEARNGWSSRVLEMPDDFAGCDPDHEDAEATAKSIAIKENLIYTPVTEI